MLSYLRNGSVFHHATFRPIGPFDPTGPTTQQNFTGTSGDDDFTGTSNADTFDLTQGGNDKASGKAGQDTFTLGGAFTAQDRFDGGADIDALDLDGDYSGGVLFGANTLTNVELVRLTPTSGSGSFSFTLDDANVAAGNFLQIAINAGGLTDALIVDGSANLDGTIVLIARGSASDTLIGGGGNDVFSPGDTGNVVDTIDGGGGINRVSFGTSSVGVNVSLAAQGAPQPIGGLWTIDMNNIQDLAGSVFNDNLIGNGADNWLVGNGGSDSFAAGGGNDLVSLHETGGGNRDANGAGGIDTLSFATSLGGPVTFSLALQGGGQQPTGLGFTVNATQFENLVGTSNFGDKLAGDGNANLLYGSGGNDKLNGGNGNDEVYGDREFGPVFTAGAGRSGFGETFQTGNDTLQGGNGDDLVDGGNGSDKLTGGAGLDALNGGAGADTFIFKKATDSGVGGGNRDTLDFSQADGDTINLHKIDADTTQGGNQDFFLGGSSFTGTERELIQFTAGGRTIIAGDTDGDGSAEFEIRLTTNPTLGVGDFDF